MTKTMLKWLGSLSLALIVAAGCAEALKSEEAIQKRVAPEDARLLGAGAQLFQRVTTAPKDSHIQDMEAMPVGRAFAPLGAPSQGSIIGQTIPSQTKLSGGARSSFKGKALVVLNGQPAIQVAGGPMDSFRAGAGYRTDFLIPMSFVQVEVVSAKDVEVEVEGFFLRNSLAAPQRYRLSAGTNVLRFATKGVFFDRFEVRAVRDGASFGLDNLASGGKMSSRPVVCRDISGQ